MITIPLQIYSMHLLLNRLQILYNYHLEFYYQCGHHYEYNNNSNEFPDY